MLELALTIRIQVKENLMLVKLRSISSLLRFGYLIPIASSSFVGIPLPRSIDPSLQFGNASTAASSAPKFL